VGEDRLQPLASGVTETEALPNNTLLFSAVSSCSLKTMDHDGPNLPFRRSPLKRTLIGLLANCPPPLSFFVIGSVPAFGGLPGGWEMDSRLKIAGMTRKVDFGRRRIPVIPTSPGREKEPTKYVAVIPERST
jgi:hypothetical protein